MQYVLVAIPACSNQRIVFTNSDCMMPLPKKNCKNALTRVHCDGALDERAIKECVFVASASSSLCFHMSFSSFPSVFYFFFVAFFFASLRHLSSYPSILYFSIRTASFGQHLYGVL
jgi:hypothetical protein